MEFAVIVDQQDVSEHGDGNQYEQHQGPGDNLQTKRCWRNLCRGILPVCYLAEQDSGFPHDAERGKLRIKTFKPQNLV